MYGTHELRIPRVAVEGWRVQTGLASAQKKAEREGEQMMNENGHVGRAHGTPRAKILSATVTFTLAWVPLNVVLVVVWKRGGQVINGFCSQLNGGPRLSWGPSNEVPLLVAPTRLYKR